jgi:hypothetical protein
LSISDRIFRLGLAIAGLACAFCAAPGPGVEAVRVPVDVPVIDLTNVVERNKSDGDVIQISTAPGPDGIVRRIAVKARESERARTGSSSRSPTIPTSRSTGCWSRPSTG